ncbi:OmpA family protein [Pontibacter sp. G13]|uniref:OmpA family protein n=1 Tax=Pontibacter sp. G13 TaxID=3074898 RepID=UPI00288954E6|nr:OmpA family protein [Pontibacter sp. G13]WNJ16212.1 OmpA family protein [Pontibacter sp. G13]
MENHLSRIFPLFLTCLLSICLISQGYSQGETPEQGAPIPEENILHKESIVLRVGDSEVLANQSLTNYFPNLGEIDMYADEKAMKVILDLQKKAGKAANQGDNEKLEEILIELDEKLVPYINNFGIRNFRDNNFLLWLAGGVKEKLQDTSAAIYYFQLAKLQNYGRGEQMQFSYDSLIAKTATEWLPLEEYFAMLELRKQIDPLVPPKKVLENMGPAINSTDADYAPFMHPSDSVLIFTSRRDTSGMDRSQVVDPYFRQNEDLYVAEIDFVSGGWMAAHRLSDTINTEFNEGSACLSPDAKTLYFTRCREGRGFGNCDIYQASYDPGTRGWINVHNLGGDINSDAWDSQPNISADGRTLFFASNRENGFGGVDLYYATMDDNGIWSSAKNLGPMINTPNNEVTPFFHRINQTLYFGSSGHLKNFGGYDIFKARRMSDRWETPKNIGPLVNTPGNEYYFSINGLGTKIFYANSKNPEEDHVKQDFDLFSFPMPMEARPDAVVQLSGFLMDSTTGHPLVGSVMVLDMEEGVEIAPKKINEHGFFEFDLVNNRKYRIYVMGDNFLTVKNDLVISGDTSFQIFTESFAQNKPIVFESLEFNSNSSKLSGTVKPKLDYIIRFLKHYPMFKLHVDGHTDSDGRAESNMRLSVQRAQSIADYISTSGEFEAGRIQAHGFGETKPLVPNDSEENKRKNRRVEFILYIDENYEGDMHLPTSEELFFDDELDDMLEDEMFELYNEDFETEVGEEAWDEELLDDLDEELEEELESDILIKLGEEEESSEEEEIPSGR